MKTFAGAGDISHKGFSGLRSALWCFFLFWSLPVLQQWSSLFVASVCSVWCSAWLCLCGWWGWSFGSCGTAAGCLSWEVWWPRTGSMWLAILLSIRSCCRLSLKRWLLLLHLHRPVLLGCCQLQVTSLYSMIVLQSPLLCGGWGGRPLCLDWDSSVLMDLHWPCHCTAQSSHSEQYSVCRFSICRSSARQFPARSWIVVLVAFPRFTVVKSESIQPFS